MEPTTVTGGELDVPSDIAAMLVDPAAYADHRIHDAYRWLRANNPLGIARPEKFDPFWVVTRHAHLQAVSRQNDLFHNADRPTTLTQRAIEARIRKITGGPNLVRSLVQMDAPDHPKYRALTQGWFMPANLDEIRTAHPRDRARDGGADGGEGRGLRFRRRRSARLSPACHHGNSRRAGEGRAADAEADAGIVRSAGPRHGADQGCADGRAIRRDDGGRRQRFRRLFPGDHRRPAPPPARGSRDRDRECEDQWRLYAGARHHQLLHDRRDRGPRHHVIVDRGRDLGAGRKPRTVRAGQGQSGARSRGWSTRRSAG